MFPALPQHSSLCDQPVLEHHITAQDVNTNAKVMVDCANGVGTMVLASLKEKLSSVVGIELVNADITDAEVRRLGMRFIASVPWGRLVQPALNTLGRAGAMRGRDARRKRFLCDPGDKECMVQ